MELQKGRDWDPSDCILKVYPEREENPEKGTQTLGMNYLAYKRISESSEVTFTLERSKGRNSQRASISVTCSSLGVEIHATPEDWEVTQLIYYQVFIL